MHWWNGRARHITHPTALLSQSNINNSDSAAENADRWILILLLFSYEFATNEKHFTVIKISVEQTSSLPCRTWDCEYVMTIRRQRRPSAPQPLNYVKSTTWRITFHKDNQPITWSTPCGQQVHKWTTNISTIVFCQQKPNKRRLHNVTHHVAQLSQRPRCTVGQFWVRGGWWHGSDNTLHQTLSVPEN